MHGIGAAVTDGQLFVPAGGPTPGGADQSTVLQVLAVPR
jgi:hypothetical protein